MSESEIGDAETEMLRMVINAAEEHKIIVHDWSRQIVICKCERGRRMGYLEWIEHVDYTRSAFIAGWEAAFDKFLNRKVVISDKIRNEHGVQAAARWLGDYLGAGRGAWLRDIFARK